MRNLSKTSIKQLKKSGKLFCLKNEDKQLYIGIADTWLIWPLKNKLKGVKIINNYKQPNPISFLCAQGKDNKCNEQCFTCSEDQKCDNQSGFVCIGCMHYLPKDFQMRTEGYCYLCDPNVTIDELLSLD